MGYRIVEITKPSECHVSNGQLAVEQEEGTVQIPVEDSKKSCVKHQNRIQSYRPPTGEVRMLILTEKQFENCLLCQEKPDLQEKLVGAKDIVTL